MTGPVTAEPFPDASLASFLVESLGIEGIHRTPTEEEVRETRIFIETWSMSIDVLLRLQAVYAHGKPLRDRPGMNVRVGSYHPPMGGDGVPRKLEAILKRANQGRDPWRIHAAYEALHPFMDGNGRTGRALWAWQMHRRGLRPFALPFLHRFYYQTLAAVGPQAARW